MKSILRSSKFLFFLLLFCSSLWGGLLFDKSEYAARRKKLMDMIPDGMAFVLGAPSGRQSNDFLYLSGVELPKAILVIDGKKKESILFFTMAENAARETGLDVNLVRNPKEVTGIEKYYPAEQFDSYLSQRFYSYLNRQRDEVRDKNEVFYTSFKPGSDGALKSFLADSTFTEWDGRLTRELQFVKFLKERFPDVKCKDCSEMIWDLRRIKSQKEIELMRKVARIGVKAHLESMKATRPGMQEYELAALFEYMCKKDGAQDLAFRTIITSGENNAFVHYSKYDRILKDGDFVVLDAGPDLDYYKADITISYPANGKFSPRQREIYEACNEISKACMRFYRPGISCIEVGEKVKTFLRKGGYDLSKDIFQKMRFFKEGGCTHFVGMDTHDAGGADVDYCGPLKSGMVISCDLFANLPEEDLAIRIENNVLITKNGCENLTGGLPREIGEIEALMRK